MYLSFSLVILKLTFVLFLSFPHVIPKCILPKIYDYSSNDVISIVIIDNKMFHVIIEMADGKVGFTVGIDVIVSQLQLEVGCFLLFTKSFGNYFLLNFFGKNGVEMNFPDVDVDEAVVAPIDSVNDVDVQPDGRVRRFVRMAGENYFVSFNIILQTAK
ncbi:hypothetical protein HanRHA438_Chr06g0268331 [Helianthus annuus]|uniref:Uncharacterized protein n=2 Tax=Helianthus annuus TaxID=4232 RepID=A0A9K3IST8_HELAN|nr:hypothetical protein HanXRQr2_Chr06g0259271 [Helianthus annuus]KAJ0560548.1 hypothetical protein HanHA300_Chr06g0212591 [Helianthus annuus]KAJ0566916.1 hypothetical protein HanIR_Chr06g0278901 [Helianthus annuus]KAJ0573577.1 hypothetical protein HanHA89_Chr06g0228291 [Helianthus annuus]KAJ0737940.1 hypothetical protein HanLR1_Chr06g0212521 [Helianthus annuus]